MNNLIHLQYKKDNLTINVDNIVSIVTIPNENIIRVRYSACNEIFKYDFMCVENETINTLYDSFIDLWMLAKTKSKEKPTISHLTTAI